jgi:hypothetical protein
MVPLSKLSFRARLALWFPGNWLPSLKAAQVLWRDYGHFRSVISGMAVAADGHPLPWYTYPAIEFLSQLDFSDMCVFEFGSGMSTLWWAGAARRVVSVEDEEQWFKAMTAKVPANVRLIHEPDLVRYPDVIRPEGEFHVVVVDGPARGRTRLKCCRTAVTALRDGGLIVLDNSDWLPESSKLLRESGLLEVDFTGFAPICGHVQTTSLYFHRSFNVQPVSGRQPMPGRGARLNIWERPFVAVPGPVATCAGESFRGIVDDVAIQFATASGPRRFRALSYLGADDLRCIAILDCDNDRVVLTRHRPRRRRITMAGEISRIAAMSWDEFRMFITGHEYRRHVL